MTLEASNVNKLDIDSVKKILSELKDEIFGNRKHKKNAKKDKEKQDSEPKIIPASREYKIYKLGLGSIVPIKGDIQKAIVKITNTPKLSNILKGKDVEFETIIPNILKESMMNNDAISSTGAVGYFQLKPIAVKDVIDTYGISDLKLNVNDPVDNIILGSLYRKIVLKTVKQGLNNLSDYDLEKITILSYNAGAERIKRLFKESKSYNYQEFEKFLAKKLGVTKDPIKKRDKTYGVDYLDPLSDLNIDNLKTREDKKIAEGLRYVAIIDGISGYIKSHETMETLGKITINKDNTLYSAIIDLRKRGIFKENASVNEICKIILESNGYGERQTPEGTELLLIKEALIDYLP